MVRAPAISADDQARLTEEIRAAEARSAGEIFVVIASEADDFRLVPVLWAALSALLTAWVLYLATALSFVMILSLQAAVFLAAALVLSLPSLRFRIIPPSLAEDAVHRAALTQFMAHGVHRTQARTGILIYVSMAPRRIELVADSGIHAKVGNDVWQATVEDAARKARAGSLCEGLVGAIRSVGALLEKHFPRQAGDVNELPDAVVRTGHRFDAIDEAANRHPASR